MLRMTSLTRVGKAVGLVLMLSALALTILIGCSSDEKITTVPEVTISDEKPEFDIVKDAVIDYLADKAGNMKAEDLHAKIANGQSPYIVSIRSADDFDAGHIPGAVNYAFGDLSTVPKGKEVLIYCYTGQSASFGAVVLGILGYDVQNLLHGMASWTTDPDIYKTRFNPSTDQGDHKVETTANEGGNYTYPTLENTTSTSESEIVKAAVATVSPKYITNADLNTKITDGEEMTVLSVRSAEHYATGHIPGAINIGLDNLVDNLYRLNPDAPVYVYCYTGHSSAQAAALLQMLGYDAYSLKYGMCSWTPDTSVNMDTCFKASSAADYEIE